jgi:hypothetical protein
VKLPLAEYASISIEMIAGKPGYTGPEHLETGKFELPEGNYIITVTSE